MISTIQLTHMKFLKNIAKIAQGLLFLLIVYLLIHYLCQNY